MNILGIETSCDETAAAVVQDGTIVLGNAVRSQIDIHKAYGGVVPEVAARSHIEVMLPVITEALNQAFPGKDEREAWGEIDAIAVTRGPGLLGALLIGALTAKTLAYSFNKPLYGVNHVLAHNYVNWFQDKKPKFPILSLTVSGNHSQLMLIHSHDHVELLGETQDDAVGEAFDKVAKVIGLPYPGGPSVSKAAESGNPHAFTLPISRMQGKYDFSFSGLKTAVLRTAQKTIGKDHTFPSFEIAPLLSEQQRNDLAASFQYTAIKTLVDKTLQAFHDHSPACVIIGGGVAANSELRRQLKEALPIDIEYAPIHFCTDNGAMIAARGFFEAQVSRPTPPFELEVDPGLRV